MTHINRPLWFPFREIPSGSFKTPGLGHSLPTDHQQDVLDGVRMMERALMITQRSELEHPTLALAPRWLGGLNQLASRAPEVPKKFPPVNHHECVLHGSRLRFQICWFVQAGLGQVQAANVEFG